LLFCDKVRFAFSEGAGSPGGKPLAGLWKNAFGKAFREGGAECGAPGRPGEPDEGGMAPLTVRPVSGEIRAARMGS